MKVPRMTDPSTCTLTHNLAQSLLPGAASHPHVPPLGIPSHIDECDGRGSSSVVTPEWRTRPRLRKRETRYEGRLTTNASCIDMAGQ
jgi:hypothetical protein